MFTHNHNAVLSASSRLGAQAAPALLSGAKRLLRRAASSIAAASLAAGLGLAFVAPLPTQAQQARTTSGRPRPTLSDRIDFEAYSITFRHGVPVGGRSHITLYQDGRYYFTGHFHVSGAPSYNVGIAWAVRTASGEALMFSKRGHLHGTFEHGSRDFDWNDSGTNPDIQRNWAQLAWGGTATYKKDVNMDINALITQATQAAALVGQIVKVIQVVAP